jgi:hypothetical protein
MNPDQDLFDLIVDLIEKIIGHPVSPFVEKALALFFILAIFVIFANALILGVKKIIIEIIIPIFYNGEQKRRRSRRKMFADYIESEIRYLNSRESWNDNRFAELEAEVEAEGKRKVFGLFTLDWGGESRIRREKSLSHAIENSAVPLVLLEGDPGSGKSVALRHVAQQMSRKASESRSLKSIIPLYINLKNLKRYPDEIVDRNFIKDFVLKTINRINDRDIEEFFKEEFQSGIEDGTWFFLFDSFDEIPEILSSTEADNTIRVYAEAIRDFLHGMNKCKGIVASREYKGPRYLGWPKFRIIPLSNIRRSELIKRTNLPSVAQDSILAGISFSSTEFRAMASNPMFLSLLCEYMQKKDEFPLYTHVVYEEYIWKRLLRDAERLKTRFAKSPQEIRDVAEKMAFCMTADNGLGLNPSINALNSSAQKLDLNIGDEFEKFIDALEYLKLARTEIHAEEGVKYFTFAHRRFQEYFATAIVLKEPFRISPKELLLNAQWRETAVTLLQTQKIQHLETMLSVAENIFSKSLEQLGDAFDEFNLKTDSSEKKEGLFEKFGVGLFIKHMFENKLITTKWLGDLFAEFDKQEADRKSKRERKESYNNPIAWPQNMFHVLSILQDGRSGKGEFLPPSFQNLIDKFLSFACNAGSLDDTRMALEIAGTASKETFFHLLRMGFRSKTNWIKSSAYRQLARFGDIPPEFAKFIRAMLVTMMFRGNLFWERKEIYAQLSRLDKSKQFINIARLLAWCPILDHLFVGISLVIILSDTNFNFTTISVVVFAILLFLLFRWYSKPLWELGFGVTANNYYDMWLNTPHAYAIFSMFLVFVAWFIMSFSSLLFAVTPPSSTQNAAPSILLTNSEIFSLAKLLIVFSLNMWATIVSLEVLNGKRTQPIWPLIYLIYPLLIVFLVPFISVVFLALELIVIGMALGDGLFILSHLSVFLLFFKGKANPVRRLTYLFFMKFKFLGLLLVSFPLTVLITPVLNNNVVKPGNIAVFILILISIILALVIFNFIRNLINRNVEFRRYKTSIAKDTQINILELLEYLSSFSQKSVRLLILRDAFTRQLIIPNHENVTKLRNVIAFVQAITSENNKRHYEYLQEQDSSLAHSLGIVASVHYPKRLIWDIEQIDILCQILVQIQVIGNQQ